DELGVGQTPGAIEGRDHVAVGLAARGGKRIRVRKALEELSRAVARAGVRDDQTKGLGRRSQTLEAGPRVREPIEDRHHEADARGCAHSLASACRSGRTRSEERRVGKAWKA